MKKNNWFRLFNFHFILVSVKRLLNLISFSLSFSLTDIHTHTHTHTYTHTNTHILSLCLSLSLSLSSNIFPIRLTTIYFCHILDWIDLLAVGVGCSVAAELSVSISMFVSRFTRGPNPSSPPSHLFSISPFIIL